MDKMPDLLQPLLLHPAPGERPSVGDTGRTAVQAFVRMTWRFFFRHPTPYITEALKTWRKKTPP
jgi:hypothetical protein